ncbi:PA0069 family radical SAM protein [Portibacter lacus]|uniref:MoaA/nifB/pqqE family protein n=1 Tax=Portibacter lacus TaxID=1099794 RepID=A0AA37SLC1_9BACT|nr:PA0069 family radical SAM protein [Portibacter lacus]GLR16261.1 moaA/nifB/pqqE family protein [Portibacter lacus]
MKLKGRGASINPSHRFEHFNKINDVFQDLAHEEAESPKTQVIPTFPKTIVNPVVSDDLPFGYSLNPYQGCEHGCIYCYARPTHNYWGYSSGLDFEQKILVKKNAAELLENKLKSKKWKTAPIALSGNTDCYQPIEAKLRITRSLLEVFYSYRHPVTIITKNSLILRDLDILKKLNEHHLLHVAVSVTSLDQKLQQRLEPRTASPQGRLKIIKTLSDSGIPVMAMMAPIIPGLTDFEIMALAKETADHGANSFSYGIVRLNEDLDQLFIQWLDDHLPDRKDKVLNKIKSMRNGKLSATIKEGRHSGHGEVSKIIKQQVTLARKLYFPNPRKVELNLDLHYKYKSNQLSLF